MSKSNISAPHLQVLDCGLLEYGEALRLQEALVSERIADLSQDRLVLVEHPPVVTLGRSGSAEDLRLCEEALKHKGASVFRTDRGGTATFMILRTTCTRRCRFCGVTKGIPEQVDEGEPEQVARAVAALGISHVVITSVTRDDLPDGGAGQFARTIAAIREQCPGVTVEVLVPDFAGSLETLDKVCRACPDVSNHNVETVARLYPLVRPEAQYLRSLQILELAASQGQGLAVKFGIMLGLGETEQEMIETLNDLRRMGCSRLTLGQYLAPTQHHLPIVRYVPPEEFEKWAAMARSSGFEGVVSGPLVRSS